MNVTKILKRVPILVYQMGKVGSSSIYQSLKKYGCHPVFHVHRINPKNIEAVSRDHLRRSGRSKDERLGVFLYERIFLRKVPVNIITLVRDPIARNISAFFQNFEMFVGRQSHDWADMDDLISRFLAEYNHDVPLKWFDDELQAVSGVDVYNYPFPKKEGISQIEEGHCRILMLKLEIDDDCKEKALHNFLKLKKELHLVNKNIGAAKNYASTYRKFLKHIQLPSDYVQKMTASLFTRHYYSETEIDRIRKRWLKQ